MNIEARIAKHLNEYTITDRYSLCRVFDTDRPPRIKIEGKSKLLAHVIYEFFYKQKIPKRGVIKTTCNNPKCLEVLHLHCPTIGNLLITTGDQHPQIAEVAKARSYKPTPKDMQLCPVCQSFKSERSLDQKTGTCFICIEAQEQFEYKIHGKFDHIGGCHIWNRALINGEHPSLHYEGRTVNVRREIYYLLHKKDDEKSIILSTCGDTKCVNPSHMYKL